MKTAVIKSSWIGMHPTRRMDAGFWILVCAILSERDINPATATNDEALEAIKEAEGRLEANLDAAKTLRVEAQTLQREARKLETAPKPTKQRKPKPYQPKTGAKCSCRPGVQRDNCPNCEGTGWVIDFQAIRNRNR